MNRAGAVVAGVTVGLLLSEIGHGLFFRNPDYITGGVLTIVLGLVIGYVVNSIGEEWV